MSDEYPLELVASIAARLLHGEDYAAASQALDLLNHCRAAIPAYEPEKKQEMEAKKEQERISKGWSNLTLEEVQKTKLEDLLSQRLCKESPSTEGRRPRLSGQTGLRPVGTAGDGGLPGQPGGLSSGPPTTFYTVSQNTCHAGITR